MGCGGRPGRSSGSPFALDSLLARPWGPITHLQGGEVRTGAAAVRSPEQGPSSSEPPEPRRQKRTTSGGAISKARVLCIQVASPVLLLKVHAAKRQRSLPQYLSASELRTLLDAVIGQRNTFSAFRDYAIMATFVYTGLRRMELLNLKIADVDLAEGALRIVSGKGGKTRVIPIVAELRRPWPTGSRCVEQLPGTTTSSSPVVEIESTQGDSRSSGRSC